MIPPTITDKMILPMIEILIGEPISANTILMPISTAMNTRNLCIRPVGTGAGGIGRGAARDRSRPGHFRPEQQHLPVIAKPDHR